MVEIPVSSHFFTNKGGNTLMKEFEGILENNPQVKNLDAVVGFLRASGYFTLRPFLDNINKVRILIGIDVDKYIAKAHQRGELFFGAEEQVKEECLRLLKQDIEASHYTKQVEDGMLQMVQDMIDGKLELRAHPSKKIHAKFYILYPDNYNQHTFGAAITGSSNLSGNGLGIGEDKQYEFNVKLTQFDDVSFAKQEFEFLWQEAEGVPIYAADYQATLDKTYLKGDVTPYELYMRMLIDHFGTQVEDDFVPVLPDGYDDLTYQRDAVVQGYDIMLRHNGCFIADVVGLGKTVIAAMIAQRFIAQNGDNSRVLVIFPPAVRSNWEDTFRDFGIKNKYSRFVSNGSLDKVIEGDGYDEPPYYDLVIVDEAHNFRHDSTGNYDLLQRITKSPRANKGNIAGGKKVLLLSATPLNNTPEDIKNQLLLFQDTARCTLDGVSNIADTFAPWIKDYNTLMSQRRTITPEALASRIDAINQQLRHTVLEKVMVRRTRSNIQHEPRYAGEITFPQLLDPEDRTYQMPPGVLMLFVETYKKLIDTPTANLHELNPEMFNGSGLRYARYRAIEYCPSYKVPSGKMAKHMADSLASIYQTHMVKRLESSFDAFKKSLHTLLDATKGMIKMFREDKVIIAPDLNVKKLQADGMELDEIIELALGKGYDQEQIVFHAAEFLPDFLPMLEYDTQLLGSLCKRWDAVNADPKLDLFVEMLQGELFDAKRNPSGKLVVFSESVDTVNFLTDQLKKRLHRSDILSVCARDRNRKKEDIRTNFDANHKKEKRDDYNIIITSDVLAEGINLHRANVIVNYDSPWNATRLMQRIGRVNRIGSTAKAIYNYMFYPSDPGDSIISLKKNSLIKLQSFHSALGEDTKIYSHDEIVKEFRLFNSDVRDDTDRSLELLREVRALHDNNPTLYRRIKQLPPKSRCARVSERLNAPSAINPTQAQRSVGLPHSETQSRSVGQQRSVGLPHSETQSRSVGQPPLTIAYIASPQKKAYYLVSDNVRELSFLEAADIFRAEPSEKAVPFGDSEQRHYEQVQRAMTQYTLDQQHEYREEKPKIGGRDNDAKKAAAFLREVRPSLMNDQEALATLDRLKQLVERGTYNQLADHINRMSRKHKKTPMQMFEIVKQLEALDQRYGKDAIAATPKQPTVAATADIILSETFI